MKENAWYEYGKQYTKYSLLTDMPAPTRACDVLGGLTWSELWLAFCL